MQNYAQIGNIDHYSLQNIFIISINIKSLNPSTYLQRYSFLYWMVLEKIRTFQFQVLLNLTNNLLRSDRFTKQSFAIENKFLPRTVYLHKLERNLMQSLELDSIVS